MKFLIAFVALFALFALAAAGPLQEPQTLSQSSEVGPENYAYSFETSNGINAQEQGKLQNAGTDYEAISARGSFSYIGDDGQTYTVTYIADENGFQPQGAHLPVAPQA
ncbi:larval cuticle protein 65Ag1 [Drosophila erecta]|uniref:Uncharacterized protein n=1 Tax=Drosophila erecta TaxID=7220 RepID=B3NGE0_DROER|nr:larval cuticle protein 65Ag1 [Drosophila erecta]EDV51106.1 uncharacterized protein Dere_GG14082 [Drosophila erecta]